LGKFIEKTVEFLRWRPDNIEVNQHDIVKLKLENNSYGIQSAENAFIIWKYKVKWQPLAKYFIKDNIILSYLLFQKRKKRRRKLDSLINLFLKTDMFSHFLMKRNVIYNILNKENLNEMMRHYFKIRRTYGRRKLFDCTNHPNPGLNQSFNNPIFIQNTSEEIDPNRMKKDVNPNQVFTLKFLEDNSFDEMWRCNVRKVLIKDVKNKQQNPKRIPVVRNRTLKIY
jgi:hypothetical protein